MGAGLGAGLGMAMGARMAQTGPWGSAPAAPSPPAAPSAAPVAQTPPPPPGARLWHVGENGATKGPYSVADLALMVTSGAIGGDTWLWTPGGPDWRRGRDIAELADIFSAPPPPPIG